MHEPIVYRLLNFSQKHAVPVMVITAALTLVMGYFALHIEINPDIESLLPDDEENIQLMEKYGKGGEYSDYLMVAVESDNPFTLEGLRSFGNAIQKIGDLPNIRPFINPFNMITFQKNGKKLDIVKVTDNGGPPRNEEELVRFRENIVNDPFARKLIISDNGKMLSAIFGTKKVQGYRPEILTLLSIISELEDHYKVYVSGLAMSTYTGILYVKKDLPRLLSITAVLILLIYYLGFRAKRAVILPMAVISFGTVWSVGFMGLLHYPLTVISIATPPLVLILGSSYSIHILNQYYREGARRSSDSMWITRAVAHVNRTIMLASATTIIGFGSLLATTTRQSRQFGISTSVGIISCALLSLFFLPAAISLMKPPTNRQSKKVLEGTITRAMKSLSRFVLRYRILVFAAVALTAVAFGFSLRHIKHQTDYVAYFPPHEKHVQDTIYTAEHLSGFQQIQLTLTAPGDTRDYFLDREALEKISRFEEKLKSHKDVVYVASFVSYLKHLNRIMTGDYAIPEKRGLILLLSRYIKTLSSYNSEDNSMIGALANADFSQLSISFRVYNSEDKHYLFEDDLRELVENVKTDMHAMLDPATKPELWGSSLRFLTLSKITNRDQRISMLISIILIFTITSIAFRSLRYGFCSLFPLVTGIMTNFIAMALLQIPLDMTTVMVTSVAIGVGVDNSIHLLIQFRKQHTLFPNDISKALSNTLTITGRPILLTTASIVGGLLVLTFSSFRPIIYFGILVSITLFATAIGSLVVLPVILSLGRKSRLD